MEEFKKHIEEETNPEKKEMYKQMLINHEKGQYGNA